MAKEAYYFSHDSNARNDEKVLMLRAEHGWEGYGIYWVLIEMMFENSDTELSHNKIKGIAVSYNIDIALLESVINTCIREELFVSDNDTFWSESLRRRKGKYLDIKQKRSEAGRKGMAKRWGSDNTVITNEEDSYNNDIAKDNKGKESKVKEKDIYIVDSEFLWSLYPEKKGKAAAIKKLPKLIKEYGKEQIERTIQRYMEDVESKRRNGFPELNYKNGSTFFNGGYADYLDENYSKPQKEEGYKPKISQYDAELIARVKARQGG